MKLSILILLVVGLMAFNVSGMPQWPFSSSKSNSDLVENEYASSPVERYVAKAFGDEIPKMRDDLIDRKNDGEGFVERHWNAWRDLDNWKVDPNNDMNESDSGNSGLFIENDNSDIYNDSQ